MNYSMEQFFGHDISLVTVFESLRLLLLLMSIVSIPIGIALFFSPSHIRKLNHFLNRWYSERKRMKPLEIMRNTDDYVFKNNRIWGWLMLNATVFALYLLIFNFPNTEIIETTVRITTSIYITSFRFFLIVFIMVGIPIWFLLIFSPNRLQPISQYFNQWKSTRLLILPLEKMHYGIDNYIFKYYQIFGAIITAGSIVILYIIL